MSKKKNIHKTNQYNSVLLFSTAIFMMGIFTLKSFLSSDMLEVVFLLMTLFSLILYYSVSKDTLVVYRVEIMWFIFLIYFIFNILYQGRFMRDHVLDIFIFIFIFILLLLYKINVNYITIAIKTIFIFSFIYALSAIFQLFYMDLYTKYFLYRFNNFEIEEILRLFRNNNYTGFTAQTAYLAGFLVYGIGAILVLYRSVMRNSYRILLIIGLPLLFYALLLTGKRGHLLFMVVSVLITFLFSTELKKLFNQIIKVIVSVGAFIIIIIISFKNYTPTTDSQIGKLYIRIENTIESFILGEDITSGRIYLYDHAFKLFNESPILGIGWRGFQELSVGVLNLDRGSHPHNIYFQLLTELGFIGFILFIIPVIYIFIRTIRLLMNSETIFENDSRWKIALQYSLYVQSFFLLYGITGNLLTDHIFLLMYFFAVTIALSSMKYAKICQVNINQPPSSSFDKTKSSYDISSM